MRFIAQDQNSPRDMLLLASELLFVHATTSCRRMASVISSVASGSYSPVLTNTWSTDFNYSQCNIDYIVLSTLKHEDQKDIKLSYDIACSWSKHVEEHIKTHYPVTLQLKDGTFITFLIPKFHLPAHGVKCRTKFSFNFNRNAPIILSTCFPDAYSPKIDRFVGRTHGETIEQEWSHINGAVLMTREMGPGARHAALDDHWGGWNWMKLVTLGELLP